MNIYQKMILAKHDVLNTKMKKTGKNTFAGWSYFELDDIIPAIMKAEIDYKFLTAISFSNDYGVLTVTNAEEPSEVITYTMPMAESQIKGCQPVQNLGGSTTYIRRYLLVLAFGIGEHDSLDSSTGGNGDFQPPIVTAKPTPAPAKTATTPVKQETVPQGMKITMDQKKHLTSFATTEEKANNIRNTLKRFGYAKAEEVQQKDFDAIMVLIDDTALPFTLA